MPLQEFALKCGFEVLAKVISKSLDKAFDEKTEKPQLDADELMQRHVAQVERWSRELQVFFMRDPVATDVATVPLAIDGIPRRFRLEDKSPSAPVTEADILHSSRSTIILADPGAGKTTTLKRLARHFFFTDGELLEFPWRLPILVIVRQINSNEPIEIAIARTIGLPIIEPPLKRNVGPKGSSQSVELEFEPTRMWESPDYDMNETNERDKLFRMLDKANKCRIGTRTVEEFIPDLLNELRALILIDGIDEFPSSGQEMLWQSIGRLNSALTESKIIGTCRSGEFLLRYENVTLCEIEPLAWWQMEEIANLWFVNSAKFVETIQRLPYADLACRPLFFCYLLALFKNNKGLPERPRHVYERIVLLALEEWDRSKGIERRSRYAGFRKEEKLEFLAHLAYHLTYRVKSKRFSHAELVSSYQHICTAFQLPRNEAVAVANELESHTGLLVVCGFEHFEFSHLSLQEYLCAHYLVRNPHSDKMATYLKDYPPPVAIATAMSSDPGDWFSFIVSRSVPTTPTLARLLTRLADERPFFTVSATFGVAVLRIMFAMTPAELDANSPLQHPLSRFLLLPNVRESVSIALESYKIAEQTDDTLRLLLVAVPGSDPNIKAPTSGVLARRFYDFVRPTGTLFVD